MGSAALFLIATLVAGPALGQTPAPHAWRLEVGTRLGYAFPVGRYEAMPVSGDGALSHDIAGAVPVAFDVGMRRHQAMFIGLAAEYALVIAKPIDCTGFEPCGGGGEGQAIRAAVETQYAFMPGAPLRSWVGLGAGVEWLTSRDTTYRGVPFVELSVGGDYAVAPQTRLGPFLSLSAGRFGHADFSGATAFQGPVIDPTPPPPPVRDIAATAWHGWIQLGIRGSFQR